MAGKIRSAPRHPVILLPVRTEAQIAESNRLQQSLTPVVPKLVIGRVRERLILKGRQFFEAPARCWR